MKYTIPRGTQDFLPDRSYKFTLVEQCLRDVAEVFCYQEIRTPIFENTELFTRSVGESSDIVNKEMYTFLDRGNRSITLRPEGTAGVVRAYIENKLYVEEAMPLKLYYSGLVFRYERPQAGRYRQINQFGFECLGARSPHIDAEIIYQSIFAAKKLGIENVKVKINSVGDVTSRNCYREALVNYFTPHLDHLCEDCKRRIQQNSLRILDCKVDGDSQIVQNAPKLKDFLNEESKEYFKEVIEILDSMMITYEIDDNLVRGLDYYCDTVFELDALTKDGKDYGAIGAGGRYDTLVENLGGPQTPSAGMAFGVERLILLLDDYGIFDDYQNRRCLVYVMPLSKKIIGDAQAITQILRNHEIPAEMDFYGKNIKTQFKNSEKLGALYNILIGEQELDEGKVIVKNNVTQNQELVDVYEIGECMRNLLGFDNKNENGCGENCECEDEHHCKCSDDLDENHNCCCGEDCECGDDEHDCQCGTHNHSSHECKKDLKH